MMGTIDIRKEAMAFQDGTVAFLHTSWDIEKKMSSEEKGNMDYTVVSLSSDDVFSPVRSWTMCAPHHPPIWYQPDDIEEKLKAMASKWASRHIFQNRRFPIRAGKEYEEYYVKDCRTVYLTGHKTTVFAAGNTMVHVLAAENSVCLLDKKVKLQEYHIPDVTNVYMPSQGHKTPVHNAEASGTNAPPFHANTRTELPPWKPAEVRAFMNECGPLESEAEFER